MQLCVSKVTGRDFQSGQTSAICQLSSNSSDPSLLGTQSHYYKYYGVLPSVESKTHLPASSTHLDQVCFLRQQRINLPAPLSTPQLFDLPETVPVPCLYWTGKSYRICLHQTTLVPWENIIYHLQSYSTAHSRDIPCRS